MESSDMAKRFILIAGVLFIAYCVGLWAQQPSSGVGGAAQPSVADTPASQVLNFERRCTACHDNPAPSSRAPSREGLRALTPERVLQALNGPMAVNAEGMTAEQKRAMAELVTGKPFGGAAAMAGRNASAMSNRCASPLTLQDPWNKPQWNGWSPDPETGWRYQAPKVAGMTGDEVPRLKLKWAFAIPGAASTAWAQPTVVGGKVFLGSDNGFVYALDAKTGCVHWSYEAQGQVRTAVIIGDLKGVAGTRYGAFFGDYRGNVYAVDAEAGKQLWVKRVDEHEGAKITGSPVFDKTSGRLFVPVTSWEEVPGVTVTYKCCTFQGSVVALDGKSGSQIWKSYTLLERPKAFKKNNKGTELYGPAGSGVWNAPTLDIRHDVMYIGTGNSYIVYPNNDTDDAIMALDLKTGRKLWWTHMGGPDPHAGGCGTGDDARINCPGYIDGRDDDASGAPVLYTAPNGRRLVIEGQESGRITAVDPDKHGEVVWVAQAGDELGAPNDGFGGAFDGELYFKPLPFSSQSGAMSAIRAADGQRVWYTLVPRPAGCPPVPTGRGGGGGGGGAGQNPAMLKCNAGNWAGATAIQGAVFTGSRNGVMRAFSSKDGHIIWEYDTDKPFDTVNGSTGHGGGFGGPGPTVVDGMVLVGSGYAILGGAPGNVLLAFGLE
jgi:polyvinyl alcohol dehydrogenase (cytochrome)